jgi:LemA protein
MSEIFGGPYIFLGFILLLLAVSMRIYNGLVSGKNRFKNAFSQIDVQLKRRYDLIPNLIEVAKTYLKYERETLEAIIAARNSALTASKTAAASPGDGQAMKELASAEAQLSGLMGKFMAVVEAYPDLKGNQNMSQLSEELSSTENKVSFARQAYNDAVMEYNIVREQFPAVILSGILGFGPATLLELESAEERKAIRVKF